MGDCCSKEEATPVERGAPASVSTPERERERDQERHWLSALLTAFYVYGTVQTVPYRTARSARRMTPVKLTHLFSVHIMLVLDCGSRTKTIGSNRRFIVEQVLWGIVQNGQTGVCRGCLLMYTYQSHMFYPCKHHVAPCPV
jgi:hypothetical protein